MTNCSCKMSKEELDGLKAAFDSIDIDHNGVLDKNELKTFMKDSGLQPQYARLAIKIFDTDHSGTISWPEFCEFIQVISSPDSDAISKHLFKVIDADNSGSLDSKEVRKFARFLGVNTTELAIQSFFSKLDKDQDGTLSYDEVMAFLSQQ